jgi:2,3-bisphosphoglycerate-independent phosphoglycerate mutase
MKYVVLIGDGMADRPLRELGGRTPLMEAFTPNMDKLAREGLRGMVRTIPPSFPAGSDVANMSILGYDPALYYSGRAPLEAASMGVELGEADTAYRCNLVTLGFNKDRTKAHMEDYSAGHISSEEARALIEALNREMKEEGITFHAGVSYRHLMVWKGGSERAECTPPHDIIGKDITDYQPLGGGCEVLQRLMLLSVDILERHDVNKKRREEGKKPANSIWLWGQGRKPSMPSFSEKYGLRAALVSAVDLTKGLGASLGMEVLEVPGATGYLDTNYLGKAEYALRALEDVDLVYVHVEAPDEAGHSGNCKDKIRAIEDFDALVVGTVLRGMKAFDEYRILLLPDHATPIQERTHTREPVPFVIFDSAGTGEARDVSYDERIAEEEGVPMVQRGHELMGMFISGSIEKASGPC